MIVRLDRFYTSIIQIFLIIIDVALFKINTSNWYPIAFGVVIVNVVVQIIYFVKGRKIFTLGFFFIMLSYLFQVSFLVILSLGMVPSDSAIYTVHLANHSMNSFKEATHIGILSIAFVFLGYVFFDRNESSDANYYLNSVGQNYYNAYKLIGKLMSIVFTPTYIISTVIPIYVVFKYGTYGMLPTLKSFINTFQDLQVFYFTGLIVLMIYHIEIENLDKAKRIFIFALLCAAVQFFTGARSIPMVLILTLILFWGSYAPSKQFNLTKIIKIIVLSFVVLQVLYAIRSVREQNFTVSNFLTAFFSLENNLIYETLSEFGTSVFCTAAFIDKGDTWHPTYFVLREIGGILPSISSWGGDAFIAPIVLSGIEKNYSIGTTYIADYYFYFGDYSYIIIAIVGVWIAFWDTKIRKYKAENQIALIAVLFSFSYYMLNTVRATESLNLKMLLYSYIFVRFFEAIVNRGRIQK